MLTVNIDVKDKLVNGKLGTVIHIARNPRNEVFSFDDNRAGLLRRNTNLFAKHHCRVPIDKAE